MVFMAAKRAVPPPAETTEESGAGHSEGESKEPSQQPYASPFPPAEDEGGQA